MNEVIVEEAAITEFNSAYDWYMNASPEIAERFVSAFRQAKDAMIRFRELAPLCDERHRYAKLKKFPYGLIYRLDGDILRIVAIVHNRQLPGYWND